MMNDYHFDDRYAYIQRENDQNMLQKKLKEQQKLSNVKLKRNNITKTRSIKTNNAIGFRNNINRFKNF